MTRPRHAMRVNPLRSPGVIVGVPVAAAVAFGAHAVLGIIPVADQQGPPTTSGAPSAAPAARSRVATTIWAAAWAGAVAAWRVAQTRRTSSYCWCRTFQMTH